MVIPGSRSDGVDSCSSFFVVEVGVLFSAAEIISLGAGLGIFLRRHLSLLATFVDILRNTDV
jgi:hypothetical protein